MKVKGHAVCLPADIDTDLIIAGRYLRTKDRTVWAARVFEDLDPGLAGRLKEAVIVAGKNFGCGSSREQAAVALKEAGVAGVIAPSFARIFFRNAINVGLPLAEAALPCYEGEMVIIDFSAGKVYSESTEQSIAPLSRRMLEILTSGGLVEYWRKKS
jgi:methanogen homoaconitase small subunit